MRFVDYRLESDISYNTCRMPKRIRKPQVKITGWTVVGLAVLLFFGAACNEPPATPVSMEQRGEQAELQGEEWRVSRVVDGDTIEVTRGGRKEKVRLIGINTPETVGPRRPVECFGREASAFAERLLEGENVTLVPDESQDNQDRYGRLLRYVMLDDTNVNRLLIDRGYAYEYTYEVPYIYQTEFKAVEQAARLSGRGLWAPGACETPTEAVMLRKARVTETADGLVVTGEVADFLTPATGMYQAAIDDGECTAVEVEREECLEGRFYIRGRGYETPVTLDFEATIELFNYAESDISEHMLERPVREYLDDDLPFLVEVEVKQEGPSTDLREVYVP